MESESGNITAAKINSRRINVIVRNFNFHDSIYSSFTFTVTVSVIKQDINPEEELILNHKVAG